MDLRIGVDGGGTKTECIIVDSAGQIVARDVAPGSNPSLVGGDKARAIVETALAALLSPFPKATVKATLLCMAGSEAFWQETGQRWTDRGRVVTVSDSLPVLELATWGGPGLVIHAGTGSFVAARRGAASPSDHSHPFGEVHYAGGLGWRFGDPGSGYELGRRAIARALLELQGWAEPSGLSTLVQEAAGLTDVKEITRQYYAEATPEPKIAALARRVVELAAQGDAVARDIAVASASELLDIALSVAARLFPGEALESLSAGLSGRVITHPVIAGALSQKSKLRLKAIEEPAIEGVRRLVMKL